MAVRGEGLPTGFVDLRQIGFFGRDGGPVDHQLQAATLAAMWPLFRAAGARLLLLNGPVDEPGQVECLPLRPRWNPPHLAPADRRPASSGGPCPGAWAGRRLPPGSPGTPSRPERGRSARGRPAARSQLRDAQTPGRRRRRSTPVTARSRKRHGRSWDRPGGGSDRSAARRKTVETRPLLTGDTTTTGQPQPYGLVDALTNISGRI